MISDEDGRALAREVAKFLVRSLVGDIEPWRALREAEIARGFALVEVGSVPWLPISDFGERDCVSLDGDEVRIVAITAQVPRTGALTRMLAGIKDAGLRPCIVCPLEIMEGILIRWGWQSTTVTMPGGSYDEWRPPADFVYRRPPPRLICQICGQHEAVGVAASPYGPTSHAYCRACLAANAEPEFMLAFLKDELGVRLDAFERGELTTFKNGGYVDWRDWHAGGPA